MGFAHFSTLSSTLKYSYIKVSKTKSLNEFICVLFLVEQLRVHSIGFSGCGQSYCT